MPSESRRGTFVPRNVHHALTRATTGITAVAESAVNFASDASKYGLAEASQNNGLFIRLEILRREFLLRPLCGAAIFIDDVFLPTELSRKHVAEFPCTPEGALREPMDILKLIMADPHNEALAALLDGRELTNVMVGLSGADFVRVCYVLTRIDSTGARADSMRLNILIKTPGCTTDSLLVRSRQCAWGDARELAFYQEYQELQASVDRAAGTKPSPAHILASFQQGIEFCPVNYRSEHWRGMLVPVCVPKPLAMAANMWVGKQLLILCAEQDDRFRAFHDWTGISYTQCRAVVTRIARFHAANWRPDVSVASFIHHRGGYEFLSYAKALRSKHFSRYFAPMQSTLRHLIKKYAAPPINLTRESVDDASQRELRDGDVSTTRKIDYERTKRIPLSLCHGDLRPATMLFNKSFISAVSLSGLTKEARHFIPTSMAPAAATAAAGTAAEGGASASAGASPSPPESNGSPTTLSPGIPISQLPSPAGVTNPNRPRATNEMLNAFYDALPEDAILFSEWGTVSVAPFLWDFTYCTVMSLSVTDRRRFQSRLLDDYLRELVENCCLPARELPTRDVCERWVEVLTLAMVLVVWALQQTDLLHENDEIVRAANQDYRDERSLRVTAAAVDVLLDVKGVATFMECDELMLRGMKTELGLFGIA